MVLAVNVICVGMQLKVFQMDAIKKEYYSWTLIICTSINQIFQLATLFV